MKINTREKLQILIFGLNAGRNLEVSYMGGHRLKDGSFFPVFSNEQLEFNLKPDGTINSGIDDSSELSDMYAANGCISCSIEEANKVYAKMSKIDIKQANRSIDELVLEQRTLDVIKKINKSGSAVK